MRSTFKAGGLVLGVLALVAFDGACGSDNQDRFVRFDAGDNAADASADGPEVDPTLGGPCNDDVQCDDKIPCTYDGCDQTLKRCRNVPDDTLCDDDRFCSGKEKCVLRRGCAPGPVTTCQDDNLCTIDRCNEATKSCEHEIRDVDGDGDPDTHCAVNHDCDDTDPDVSSTRVEICNNFKDDDCDGEVDEQPCADAQNDVCATALAVAAPGTYVLSTVAAKKNYATTCTVKNPAAAKDVVVAITVPGVPADGTKDVEVWATSQSSSNEVALALESTCGVSASEISCAHIDGSRTARAIARGLVGGNTIYAVVTAQVESPIDVKVDVRPATPKAPNETCAAPSPITVGVPFTAAIVDASHDLVTACDKEKAGELTYSFSLAAPADVKIFASTLAGDGEPVITLRDAACPSELRCRVGTTPPVFARSLSAGTHVFSVGGTTQLDASVLVQTYPATAPPANQSCATAPPAVLNTSFAVDLSAQEDAIANGCLGGAPAAAYDLNLAVASDVLVIGRFSPGHLGAVSLNAPACGTADVLQCAKGVTPVRVSKRNVAPGSYRVVVADELGQSAQLNVLVRPTVAPTVVTASDGCVGTATIPPSGGFFTGDTTPMTGDFGAGCDAPGLPLGGARDQLLRLDIATPQRVVFDMIGSFYTTLLDVRQGAACPGTEVSGSCYVGFGPNKSFLDTTLGAGTYWIQLDGYNGDVGAWNLDVRVLPP